MLFLLQNSSGSSSFSSSTLPNQRSLPQAPLAFCLWQSSSFGAEQRWREQVQHLTQAPSSGLCGCISHRRTIRHSPLGPLHPQPSPRDLCHALSRECREAPEGGIAPSSFPCHEPRGTPDHGSRAQDLQGCSQASVGLAHTYSLCAALGGCGSSCLPSVASCLTGLWPLTL